MGIVQIHASIATTVMLFNTVLGVWGFLKFLRKQEAIDGNFWGAIALSPVLGLAQAAGLPLADAVARAASAEAQRLLGSSAVAADVLIVDRQGQIVGESG